MWSKRAPILLVRFSLRGTGRLRLPLFLPLALYVPQQLLLAWEGLLGLFPGAGGAWLRRAVATLYSVLAELMAAQPQNIADVDLADGRQRLRVVVRTCGLFSGGDEE